jgi:drug/metabolite transporter (DMT)-like permease
MSYHIYLAFIIAFFWGITPVLYKFILKNNIPSYIIIFIQACVYLLASILYIIIYENNNIYKDLDANINYIPFLAAIAFFSVYFSNFLYIYALENNANVNIMSIIVSLAPIVTIIASFLILKEKITIKVLIGFFIIFIGLICVFLPF